jgi:small subunit ribosomal protein S14
MAKLSSINKNERRKKLVKKYAGRYSRLKAIADDESVDETERLIARLKLAEIRKFRLSRVTLRDLANKGLIPGVTKSSW